MQEAERDSLCNLLTGERRFEVPIEGAGKSAERHPQGWLPRTLAAAGTDWPSICAAQLSGRTSQSSIAWTEC